MLPLKIMGGSAISSTPAILLLFNRRRYRRLRFWLNRRRRIGVAIAPVPRVVVHGAVPFGKAPRRRDSVDLDTVFVNVGVAGLLEAGTGPWYGGHIYFL